MNVHTMFCRSAQIGALALIGAAAAYGDSLPVGLATAPDEAGRIGVFNIAGATDSSNPFFKSLGSNGRSCSTCHLAEQAMSFTPTDAEHRFTTTRGADPLFAAVDGADCDTAARTDRHAHRLILSHGLIRIALAVPVNAEFTMTVVHDPYGCALRVDPKSHVLTASVYRRPLPTANLPFISAVMFDGRETLLPLTSPASDAANLRADLLQQASHAVSIHAEAVNPPSDGALQSIVDFELGLFSAQFADRRAGRLDADGSLGGPVNLASQLYYPGINDSLGADPSGMVFTSLSMTLYGAWQQPSLLVDDSADRDAPQAGSGHGGDAGPARQYARAEIAAGETLFNTLPINISNVRGLNDNVALNRPTSFVGHCATCHDAPNVGDHSLPLPLDIGTAHTDNSGFESDPLILAATRELDLPDLPVFLISGCANPFNPGQQASFYTTDPGKALLTGHCSDFNRVKGPILRGLAGRAPYFHNGAAASLREAVNFYNQRFQMKLTERQIRQLVAFLNTL